MKVVLFLFAAILIMLCAALVCPVEINARARVKPRFGEVQADICVLGTIRIKADALAVWLPLEADIRIKRQKDKAQTAKAGRQYITIDKKGNYYKAPVYNG